MKNQRIIYAVWKKGSSRWATLVNTFLTEEEANKEVKRLTKAKSKNSTESFYVLDHSA